MSDELRELEEDWAGVLVRRDVEAAGRILADDFVLSSTGGVSDHMPRDEWLAALPDVETRTVEPRDIHVREFGDVAVVCLYLRWDASIRGRDLTGDYRITDVFKRVGDGWRVSWRISVRLPAA